MLLFADLAPVASNLVTQQPLQSDSLIPTTTTIDLKYVEGWAYTMEMSLGTPPLLFTAVVDVNWSDLFVPSILCPELDRPEHCKPHPLYNSSASSTHAPDGRNTTVQGHGYYTEGNAVSDTLRFGSPPVEVQGQVFEAAYLVHPGYFFNDSWWDIAFGLALDIVRGEQSNLQVASPFRNMAQRKLLKNNAFTLTLPRSVEEYGRLVLGSNSVADLEEFSTWNRGIVLPLASPQHNDVSGGWEIGAVSLSFGSFHYPLDDHTAILSSSDSFFIFPDVFTRHVRKQVGSSTFDGSVDCDKIHCGLPDIVITLWRGWGTFAFVVRPDEYISSELKFPFVDPEKCLLPLVSDDGFEKPDFIMLGSIFLRKFHSIFDADKRSITLIERSRGD